MGATFIVLLYFLMLVLLAFVVPVSVYTFRNALTLNLRRALEMPRPLLL